MSLAVPDLSLVVLIGPSGSGKSTFARRHFRETEILSSDFFRGLVSDDPNDQDATVDAFDVLHAVARKRLAARRLTVIDATNVQEEARKPLVALARAHHVLPVAIVLDLPESLCHERNRSRADRSFGPHVVRNQKRELRRTLRGLGREGFRHVHILSTPEEVDAAEITRTPLWCDRRGEAGPFDLIGDVHGCFDELTALLDRLGYAVTDGGPHRNPRFDVVPPAGRKAVFLGDLVDRGPRIPDVLRLVMGMVASGHGICVPGNHDVKLLKKLQGRDVKLTHGLAESVEQLERESPAFRDEVVRFLDGLVSHYLLDGGRLVVAHAGMKEELQGRSSGRVRDFALYGETTGETDEYGLPVRYDWASEYRGKATVVYGHTPVPEAEWLNRTICLDTGCVYGGSLTALRYPEKELVSVAAARMYYEPRRPLVPKEAASVELTAQQEHDDLLDLADVTGKRLVTTRLHHSVTIREENAAAALEAMSRFAASPKWLIHLPPTMTPCETSALPDLLEHPAEAFAYYRAQGVATVVCEEKQMGSRAIAVVCRDEETARRRFGVADAGIGLLATRTGRRFFEDAALEQALLVRVARALETSGLFAELGTDWAVLDAELLPWSAKAGALLTTQYAPVGAAGGSALAAAVDALERATAGPERDAALAATVRRRDDVARYVDAYRRYCWPVSGLEGLKLAPFHLLASEGKVHADRDHLWHMETLHRLDAADPELLLPIPYRSVDLADGTSEAAATRWWEELTERGGEGMVVKPLDYVTRGSRGLVQPAVKCRGREYLRIIYGPEYTEPANLERLRKRGLATKRSLALKELALGIEALERFVRHEPLRRVHECVFGVLALESEPVDPRL